MMTQHKSSIKEKQKLKKLLVFALMFAGFVACMWWIFAPSASDKEALRQGVGFNSDIPDPRGAEIVDDKKTAYEQEQARLKQEQKMHSLQDYSFMLGSQNGDSPGDALMEDERQDYGGQTGNTDSYQGAYSNSRGQRSNSLEESNSAYRDINRTLNNFYKEPEPEADMEKEALWEEVERLREIVMEQQKPGTTYDDQLTLLEKSYELAAKYMPGGQGTTNGGNTGTDGGDAHGEKSTKKTKVAPITRIAEPVVSSLSQPLSGASYAGEYNPGFYTATGEEVMAEKNTIGALVHSNQALVSGQGVQLRLTEPMRAGRHLIPSNTVLTGVGKISGERLEILVSSIEHEGNIVPVSIRVVDSDGQPGIYIPGSMEMNAVQEIVGNMGQGLNSSINITQQSAGQQLLTDMGRSVIQGTSQYISKKAREVKVTLKAGHRVFLLPDDDN